jgi:deoxyribose-phosphate aldolase
MFKTAAELAGLMDHTRLSPDTTGKDIARLCEEARRFGFAAVCIPPCYVAQAVRDLYGSGIAVSTVIGFPLGFQTTSVKVLEAAEAVKAGAKELDAVLPIGAIRAREAERVKAEVSALQSVAPHLIVKFIIETGLLNRTEKINVSRWILAAGGRWIKTSTGFGPKGATAADVRLLKKTVGDAGIIKASGGIRDLKTLTALVRAGASRIGTSSGVKIMEEWFRRKGPK